MENTRGAHPNDVDVVTYFYLPDGESQETLYHKNTLIFDNGQVKKAYRVDAYFCPLDGNVCENHIQQISYWYSMWSHCRDSFVWKGFLQTSLDPIETESAMQLLRTF